MVEPRDEAVAHHWFVRKAVDGPFPESSDNGVLLPLDLHRLAKEGLRPELVRQLRFGLLVLAPKM